MWLHVSVACGVVFILCQISFCSVQPAEEKQLQSGAEWTAPPNRSQRCFLSMTPPADHTTAELCFRKTENK